MIKNIDRPKAWVYSTIILLSLLFTSTALNSEYSTSSIYKNVDYNLNLVSSFQEFSVLSPISVFVLTNTSISDSFVIDVSCDGTPFTKFDYTIGEIHYLTFPASVSSCEVSLKKDTTTIIKSTPINLSHSGIFLHVNVPETLDLYTGIPVLVSSNVDSEIELDLEVASSKTTYCKLKISTGKLAMIDLFDETMCKGVDFTALNEKLTISAYLSSLSASASVTLGVSSLDNYLSFKPALSYNYMGSDYQILLSTRLPEPVAGQAYSLNYTASCAGAQSYSNSAVGVPSNFSSYIVSVPSFPVTGQCSVSATLYYNNVIIKKFPTVSFKQHISALTKPDYQILAFPTYNSGDYLLSSLGAKSLTASDYRLKTEDSKWAYYYASSLADQTPYPHAAYGINGWNDISSLFSPGHNSYHGLTGFFFFTAPESATYTFNLTSETTQNARSLYCAGSSSLSFGHWNDNCGASAICGYGPGSSYFRLSLTAGNTYQCAFQNYMGDDLGFFQFYYTKILMTVSGPGFSPDQIQGVQSLGSSGNYAITNSSLVPYTYTDGNTLLSGNPNWNDQVYFVNSKMTPHVPTGYSTLMYSVKQENNSVLTTITPVNYVDGVAAGGSVVAAFANGTKINIPNNKATSFRTTTATHVSIGNTNIAVPAPSLTNSHHVTVSCAYNAFVEESTTGTISCVISNSDFTNSLSFSSFASVPAELYYTINDESQPTMITRTTNTVITFPASSAANAKYSVYAKTSDGTSNTLTFSTHHVSPGYYLNNATNTVESCLVAHKCSGNGIMYKCSQSSEYQDLAGQTSCKTVQSGYFKSSDSSEVICPAGFACNNGVKTACPIGTYQSEQGQVNCIHTVSPDFTNKTGSTSFFTCSKEGYFIHDNNCVLCTAGFYCPGNNVILPITKSNEWAPAGSSAPLTCELPRHVFADHASCSLCNYGYYNAPSGCTPCPVGKYCRNSEAITCPAGSFQNIEEQSTCNACKPGQYSGAGATSCTNAPAGSYTDSFNSTEPIECTASDKYQPKSGQTSCLTISTGNYKVSSSESSACLVGYSCSGNGTKDSCDKSNSYAPNKGQSSCTVIPTGYYKTSNFAIEICPIGTYCIGGVKNECSEESTYQPKTGQSSCIDIPDGSYKSTDSSIKSCPAGSFCTGGKLTSCPAGSTSKAGASSCTTSTTPSATTNHTTNSTTTTDDHAKARDLAVSHRMSPYWWIVIIICIIAAFIGLWWIYRRKFFKARVSSKA